MKLSLIVTMLLGAALYAETAMPRMISVDPENGKPGDAIAVTGENLDKSAVAKLFLTDGKNDVAVAMDEQTATTIKFKIPSHTAAGRLTLMVLTTGKDAKYIEQPVKLTIDQP